jgi:outer membrane cobalamin receptor
MVNQDLGGGVLTKRNEDTATAFGADVQAGYPFRFFSIEAGYSYIDAKARGRPVQYTTEQQYFLAVAHYFGPLVLELRDTVFANYQYGAAPQDTWGWNTVDFTLRTIGLNDYNFQAGLLNILDQPRMFSLGYPEPKRRFFISLERVF